MSEKKFDVYWNSYTDHLREMLQQMRSSEELTDVTLICDDKKQIKAHKNILGASSSKFKTIVNLNQKPCWPNVEKDFTNER